MVPTELYTILSRDVVSKHSVKLTTTDTRSNSVIFSGEEPLEQFMRLKKKDAVEGFKLQRGTSSTTKDCVSFFLVNGAVLIVCTFDLKTKNFVISVNL